MWSSTKYKYLHNPLQIQIFCCPWMMILWRRTLRRPASMFACFCLFRIRSYSNFGCQYLRFFHMCVWCRVNTRTWYCYCDKLQRPIGHSDAIYVTAIVFNLFSHIDVWCFHMISKPIFQDYLLHFLIRISFDCFEIFLLCPYLWTPPSRPLSSPTGAVPGV